MKCLHFPPEEDFQSLCIPWVFKEIYLDDVYEVVRKNHFDVILDLGAHIGIVSMFLAKFCNKLYAFEPLESHFKSLKKNVEANECKNIEAFNVAISNKVGKANFHYNKYNTTCSALEEKGERVVDTVTIEKFMEDNKIDKVDYLKMDIEGGEVDVLLGDSFARIAPKINVICLASHAIKELEIFDRLKSLGYNGQNIPCGETVNLFWRRQCT